MNRAFRTLGVLLATGALLASEIVLPLKPAQAASGQLCASPGKDGLGGTLSGTINTYYPGVGTASAGATSISVGTPTAGTTIAAGDLLLVIQMQDATINSTNTDAYGDGVGGDVPALSRGGTQPSNGASGYQSTTAGTYEYVVVGSVTGGSVSIKGAGAGGGLVNSYSTAAATTSQGQKTYQVVRVPQYSSASLGSATAAAWNGSTGGILAYDVAGNLNLAGTVDVSGKGFRGGAGRKLGGIGTATGFSNTDYRTSATSNTNGSKGEGIAGTPRYIYNGTGTPLDNTIEGYPNGSYGRGSPGNAGGGSTDGHPTANDENSGGGGGSNGGAGGIGGRSWNSDLPTGGFGGKPFPASSTSLVLGGGGGAGTTNDGTSSPNTNVTGINSSGAAGGGMVMIRTNTVSGTGTINANGANALDVANDGSGGGGAGGSVLVAALSNNLAGLTVNANGGKGGNAVFSAPHGPGGGGGGGVLVASSGVSFSGAGGASGFTGSPAISNVNGAAAGGGFSVPLAVTSIPGANSGAACVPVLTTTKVTSTPNVKNNPTATTTTYTITVSNEVNRSTAQNVSISDLLPAGFTYASGASATLSGGATGPASPSNSGTTANPTFSGYTIPGGGQVQISFSVTIPSSVVGGIYPNTATATYTDPARTTANGTTSATYTGANVTVVGANLRLVKRITRINSTDITGFVDDPTDTNDNAPNWPTPSTYLRGAITNTSPVKPGDVVEYTIYFLSDGSSDATNMKICDLVPANTSFIPTAFNGSTKTDGGLPADLGIALALDPNSLPTAPTVYLTNIADAPDRGQFYPPGTSAPAACNRAASPAFSSPLPASSNLNGAVVVDVVTKPTNLLKAISPGNPSNSYGFVRFRVRVN